LGVKNIIRWQEVVHKKQRRIKENWNQEWGKADFNGGAGTSGNGQKDFYGHVLKV
jgi:hypothetical protein